MTRNLEAQAARLSADAAEASSGRASHLVLGGPETRMTQTVVALREGRTLGAHENPGEASLLVLQGAVLVHSDGEEGQPGAVTEGRRGDLIQIPPARHDVTAVADAVVLLTAVKRWAPA